MHANLDALLTAIYVLIDDFLPPSAGPGRPPGSRDAELITLAVAQVFMGLPNDRQFLALAATGSATCFPICPSSPATTSACERCSRIERTINYLAFVSPVVRRAAAARLDPGALRRLARDRPALGVRRPRRLRLLPQPLALLLGLSPLPALRPDGTPIAFELAPANAPEREVAREMLERVPLRATP